MPHVDAIHHPTADTTHVSLNNTRETAASRYITLKHKSNTKDKTAGERRVFKWLLASASDTTQQSRIISAYTLSAMISDERKGCCDDLHVTSLDDRHMMAAISTETPFFVAEGGRNGYLCQLHDNAHISIITIITLIDQVSVPRQQSVCWEAGTEAQSHGTSQFYGVSKWELVG